MLTPDVRPKGAFKPVSIRRQVNRRITYFAILIGTFGLALAAVIYVAIMYPTEGKVEACERQDAFGNQMR